MVGVGVGVSPPCWKRTLLVRGRGTGVGVRVRVRARARARVRVRVTVERRLELLLLPRAQRGAAVARGHRGRARRLIEEQERGAAHLGVRGGGLECVGLHAGTRGVAGWGARGCRLGGGVASYVLDIEDAVTVDVAVELARAHRAAAAAALGLGLQGAPRAAWLRCAVRRAEGVQGAAGAAGAAERDVAAARADLAQVGAVVLVGAVAHVARDQALDLVGGMGLGLGWRWGLGWGWGLGLGLGCG